jgi:hypothetical protein
VRDPWHGSNWSMCTSVILVIAWRLHLTFSRSWGGSEVGLSRNLQKANCGGLPLAATWIAEQVNSQRPPLHSEKNRGAPGVPLGAIR